MVNDDIELMDINNRNYKIKLFVELNEVEVNEIFRYVYKKMVVCKI